MAGHVADDVGYEVCEVLVQVHRAGMPSAETTRLEGAAVERALWIKTQAVQQPIVDLAVVLREVAVASRQSIGNAGAAVRALRSCGRHDLAKRVQRLSKACNQQAHPDVGLVAEIQAFGVDVDCEVVGSSGVDAR